MNAPTFDFPFSFAGLRLTDPRWALMLEHEPSRLDRARELYEAERASRPAHWLNDLIELSRFPIPLVVHIMETKGAGGVVRVAAIVLDRESGEPTLVHADANFAVGASDGQVLFVVREAARTLVLHELDECLLVDGQRGFDPHAKQGATP